MSENVKTDYQRTLNLPQTEFSMRAGLSQKEPAYLAQWEKDGLYAQIRKNAQGKKKFILHDGPPYANGTIHIGHALNKILKDVIVKSKSMQGFDAWYVPGWDCHGLPIEHQLLKELKKRKSDVDCVDFRKKAHDYAMKFVDIQKEDFKRLGIFGQWEDPYLTLKPDYEHWILKSLAKLNRDGYVYRGLKPVNWCFKCETALAEAEVEHSDHTSTSVYVKFPVENADTLSLSNADKVSLLIWTTTPWTLMGNVAVAVHKQFTYACVELNDEIIILEKTLVESVMAKAGIDKYNIVKEISGEELTQLIYKAPFGEKENYPVVTADYVTKEDGTGLVHTAPGHGQDDFETGMKNNLDVVMPVNDRGVYTKEAGKYEGEHVFKANTKIVEELDRRGVLLAQEDIQHSYPHCWRCKNPIIFRATKQWFLSIDHDNLRSRLVKTVQSEVKWIPKSGEERIRSMVSLRPDWCLSRQRFWGVPIPALICLDCGEHNLFTELVEHFAERVKDEGTNTWFEKDVNEIFDALPACQHCGHKEYKKGEDILDVWFDSGVSHQAVVKSQMGLELPADLYLEGSDQHRGWFQSSLIPAVAMEGHAPYKAVLTHGFVVDGDGRKMSKSTGNVVAPQEIINNSGADILRLWVASTSYNEDVRISKEILARLVDAYRKIRNTVRYLLGNLNGFDPDTHMIAYNDLEPVDKWALYQLSQMISTVRKCYDAYEFSRLYKEIYAFCNESLSSFYLDILKDRLYTSAAHAQERHSAQTVLYHIADYLCRYLAPIIPFTAEEMYRNMPKGSQNRDEAQSVHLCQWHEVPAEWSNDTIAEDFELLVELRPFVLKALEDARRDNQIGSALQAKLIFQSSSQRDLDYLKRKKDFLPAAFIVSQVEIEEVENIDKPLGEMFSKTSVKIGKADGEKCSRCWNYRTDVGKNQDHKTLCARCTIIVKE